MIALSVGMIALVDDACVPQIPLHAEERSNIRILLAHYVLPRSSLAVASAFAPGPSQRDGQQGQVREGGAGHDHACR